MAGTSPIDRQPATSEHTGPHSPRFEQPATSEDAVPHPPRFEMVHAAGSKRGQADEPAELISALIPGYRAADPVAAAADRIRHAMHAQVTVQAAINLEFGLGGCSPEQRALLCGDRTVPPTPTRWSAPVPLVLVDCCYAPVGAPPRPLAEAPGTIRWLRPSTELDYLRSLADLGVIGLIERRPPFTASSLQAASSPQGV